jgi:hypothetical protein
MTDAPDVVTRQIAPAPRVIERGTQPPVRDYAIDDLTFCSYVKRLKDLHNFLYQEAVPVNPSDTKSLEMGNLSALYYQVGGRAPSIDEWNQVERQTQTIFILLSPALRRKFIMAGTPWIVAWMPVYLLGIAAISLTVAVAAITFILPIFWMLVVYLIWLATLGAVGALAFIGMNALSVQDDITFDLTNKRLTMLRVALGALFAVVLTLPFGYQDFISFCSGIAKPFNENPDSGTLTKQAVLLLMPFVLGFSTTLVILVLNQLVDAVQALFGQKPRLSTSPTLPPPVTSGNAMSTIQQKPTVVGPNSPPASSVLANS